MNLNRNIKNHKLVPLVHDAITLSLTLVLFIIFVVVILFLIPIALFIFSSLQSLFWLGSSMLPVELQLPFANYHFQPMERGAKHSMNIG
jgi:hypothetical protein